ncbi:MAG: hypothetical protein ACJ79H_19795 [Myxococcales bacterium]
MKLDRAPCATGISGGFPMKSGKLLVAMGAAFLLVGGRSASAAPHVHAKANSSSETIQAAVKPQPAAAAKSDAKGRAHKRPVQHDTTLDYPQLG